MKLFVLMNVLFLGYSFFYSWIEKIKDRKNYVLFLNQHLATQHGKIYWTLLILTNGFTWMANVGTLLFLSFNFEPNLVKMLCITNAGMLMILLIGQRIAKDYQGAANLGIYFLINALNWLVFIL